MRPRPDDVRARAIAWSLAAVVGWVVLVGWLSTAGAADSASALLIAVTLALGSALLAGRLAVRLTVRPVRVDPGARRPARPAPRSVDPDRPSGSRPRAPGCGRA
ncbi:MAG: hypothetical protein JNL54_19845 [Kineosporiaceae bacterium]|nr:hypothetical protein [Kineosporiaceae bacterium]